MHNGEADPPTRMSTSSAPEVWLRGPIPDIPPLLQPVAHSLLQSREELSALLPRLTEEQIRERPSGAASVAFHVRHAAGSLDRLCTYARGEGLTPAQLDALAREARSEEPPAAGAVLLAAFEAEVDRAVEQLRNTSDATLLDRREVGRARLPSTTLGLLFHAAEHTQRHAGQAVTTARMVSGRR